MEAFRQRGKSGRAAARTALGAALATDCATENVPRCGGGGGPSCHQRPESRRAPKGVLEWVSPEVLSGVRIGAEKAGPTQGHFPRETRGKESGAWGPRVLCYRC